MKKVQVLAVMTGVVTSITVLVMLTTTFHLFKEKYFPSFMLAQKYALPLVVAAMAQVFLAFFEPERLVQRSTITVMRFGMLIVLGIFSYYLATLNAIDESLATLIIYAVQWLVLLYGMIVFFTANAVTDSGVTKQ
ncbi:MAG: hypothetical protein HUU02_11495 [Bacteroidetes bacterium]|nr:hypothetical protein [Bacteroidota bacterium]